MAETAVAVAAPKKLFGAVWLIKIVEINRVRCTTQICSYQPEIAPGMVHLNGHLLERDEKNSNSNHIVYNLSKDITYSFKENILHLVVNVKKNFL